MVCCENEPDILKEKQQTLTPPTQTRANVRQSVLSRSAKFGIGRKDIGIKALFCVGGERWRKYQQASVQPKNGKPREMDGEGKYCSRPCKIKT